MARFSRNQLRRLSNTTNFFTCAVIGIVLLNGAAMNEQALRKALERFGSKPDDALESTKVSAAFLSCSERTLRYHPAAERVYITADRYNFRVGNIREIAKKGFVGAMTSTPKPKRVKRSGQTSKTSLAADGALGQGSQAD